MNCDCSCHKLRSVNNECVPFCPKCILNRFGPDYDAKNIQKKDIFDFTFESRLQGLEKHKNMQIDENRKISRRVDEENKVNLERFERLERQIDKVLLDFEKRLVKLTPTAKEEKFERNLIAQRELIDFLSERLEKLQKKLSDLDGRLNAEGYFVGKAPHKCPVCKGLGTNKEGQLSKVGLHAGCCHVCEGNGIVWG